MDLKLSASYRSRCLLCNGFFSSKEKSGINSSYWKSFFPLILKCGHTLCENCIENGLKDTGKITCPDCQEISFSSQPPIDKMLIEKKLRSEFPPNLFILGELQTVHNRSSGNTISTNLLPEVGSTKREEVCNECGEASAQVKCEQCADIYCDSCFQLVHKHKTLRKHIAKPLKFSDDLSRGGEFLVTESECTVHPTMDFAFFCNSCNLSVCPTCFLNEHKDHDIISLQEKNASIMEDLKTAADNAGPILQRLRQNLKKLKLGSYNGVSQHGASPHKVQEVEKVIRQTFINLHAQLQLREKYFLDKLTPYSGGHKFVVNKLIAEIHDHIKFVSSLLQNASFIMSLRDPKSFNLDKLVKMLTSVPENIPCHIVEQKDEQQGEIQFSANMEAMKTVLSEMKLELPKMKNSLCLVSTRDLPEGYTVQVLAPVVSSSIPKSHIKPQQFGPAFLKSTSSISSKSDLEDAPHSSVSPGSGFAGVCKAQSLEAPFSRPISSILSKSDSENVPHPSFIPGMPEEVNVYHINNPNSFYVQRKSAVTDLNNINRSIYKGTESSSPPNKVIENEIYLCKYQSDKKWYRVKILETPTDSNNVHIFYMDYGNIDSVPLSSLRKCSLNTLKIPALAIHCSLFDCVPANDSLTWAPEAIHLFVKTLGAEKSLPVSMQVFAVIENNEKLSVDLHVIGEHGHVTARDTLLKSKFARSSVKSSAPALVMPIDHVNIPRECGLPISTFNEVLVSHVESPNLIYIQKFSNIEVIEKLAESLQEHYESESCLELSLQSTDILVGQFVACKYNGNWYRGFVSEKIREEQKSDTDEDHVVDVVTAVCVYLIDYGNKELISVDNILKLHPKFCKIPAQALKCCLIGIMPIQGSVWPEDTKKALQKILTDPKSTIRALVQNEGKNQIQRIVLYNRSEQQEVCVNNHLVEIGLAKSSNPRIISDYRKKLDKSFGRQSGATTSTVQQKQKSSTVTPRFPPPSEVEFEEEVEPIDEFRKDYVHVLVTHVVHPHQLYVMKFKRQREMQLLKDKIYSMYSLHRPDDVPVEWKVFDKCVAYSAQRSCFNRASIRSISEEGAEAFFIDSGVTETVPISYLRRIDDEITKTADGVLRCSLSGIESPDDVNKTWPESITKKLKEIIEENINHLYIFRSGPITDGSILIHLWVKKSEVTGPFSPSVTNWICVNQLLVGESGAISVNSEFTGEHFESHVTSTSLKKDELPPPSMRMELHENAYVPSEMGSECEGLEEVPVISSTHFGDYLPAEPLKRLADKIIPTFVDSNCYIYFTHPDKIADYVKLQKNLRARFNDSTPDTLETFWRQNQACTVQYHLDKNWYRGKIIQILDDGKYEVLFVDYGNVEIVNVNELRKEVCFFDMPVLAVSCTFYGLELFRRECKDQAWDIKLLDFIHEKLVDVPLEAVMSTPLSLEGPYLLHKLKRIHDNEDMIQYFRNKRVLQVAEDDQDDMRSCSFSRSNLPPPPSPIHTPKIEDQFSIHSNESEFSSNSLAPDESYHHVIRSQLPKNVHELHIEDNVADLIQKEDECYDSDTEELESGNTNWFTIAEARDVCQKAESYCFVEPPKISSACGVVDVKITSIVKVSPYVSLNVNILKSSDPQVTQLIDNFKELINTIQSQAEAQPLIKIPRPKMKCIAFVTDEDMTYQWHRAEILSVDRKLKTAQIVCVDSGIKNQVTFNNIRALKPEWTEIPTRAISCVIHGIEIPSKKTDDEILLDLSDTIDNKEVNQCYMKIKKYTPTGSLSVEIFEDPETTVLVYEPLIQSGTFLLDAEYESQLHA